VNARSRLKRYFTFLGDSLCAIAAVALSANPAYGACVLRQLAELPTNRSGQPLVPISINGHAVAMVVDTGAGRSMIWRKGAEALGLDVVTVRGGMYGIGGADAVGRVHVRELALAGFTVRDLDMDVSGHGGSDQVVGLVGEDLLGKVDLEFDLAENVVRLFQPQDCKGDQVVYWSKAYFMVPLVRPAMSDSTALHVNVPWVDDPGYVVAHVSLNGQDALAMLDTGAAMSIVSADLIKRGVVRPESEPIEEAPARGIAGKPVATAVAAFPVLTIGQENIQNARLRISDLWGGTKEVHTGSMIARPTWAPADMLLGADFFRAHRVYFARSQKKMYFTYQGGPIFVLSAPQSPNATATPSPEPPSEPPVHEAPGSSSSAPVVTPH
jgi:predicted aspartyl protease